MRHVLPDLEPFQRRAEHVAARFGICHVQVFCDPMPGEGPYYCINYRLPALLDWQPSPGGLTEDDALEALDESLAQQARDTFFSCN